MLSGCVFRLAYVSHEDVCKCFEGETLLAIQAPSGTQMEVPIPEIVSKHLNWYRHFNLLLLVLILY